MAKLQKPQEETRQSEFPSTPPKKKTFDPIPEDQVVNVEVISVEIRDIKPEIRAKYKIRDTQEVSFRFKVIDGPFKNRNLWGTAKPLWNDNDNCRLRLWTQEIFGVDRMPDGYEFDTDDFPGMKARVLVRNYVKGDGTTGDGVKDVLRALPNPHLDEEPFN